MFKCLTAKHYEPDSSGYIVVRLSKLKFNDIRLKSGLNPASIAANEFFSHFCPVCSY